VAPSARFPGEFPAFSLHIREVGPEPVSVCTSPTVILKLPNCCELAEAERLVNKLNGWEWCALDSPPVVGAWTCLPEKAEAVFMTFVADEAWRPQLVGSLVDSALGWAEVARRWVVNWWE